MSYIEIDNLKINYERKGSGTRKIIFLHGNSCSMRYFDNQFNDENLLNKFELIRFDLPGHGLSDHATNMDTYSIPGLAKVFVKFYKKLKLDNAFIMANSLSGNIVLEALDNLQGIKGLLLQGTSPNGLETEHEMFLPKQELAVLFKGKSSDKEIKALSKIMFFDSTFHELFYSELKKTDSKFRELLLPSLEKIIPKNQIEIIKKTNVPITIINGENDEIMNLDYIKAVPFKNLWQNKLFFIPKTKHYPFIENPDIFNKYLIDFCL